MTDHQFCHETLTTDTERPRPVNYSTGKLVRSNDRMIAGVIGGKLADRFGKRQTLTLLLILASLALFPALWTTGGLSIGLYLAGVSLVNATMPVTAALAQEMAPQSRSMASSIVMGLSWGIANLLTGPLGIVADHFGIQTTMAIVASLPLCALPFMVFFSRGRS